MADDQNVKVQRQMAYFLPLISILYGGILPAGLFLYWIISTVIQIGQQYLRARLRRDLPALRLAPGVRAEPHAALPREAARAQAPSPRQVHERGGALEGRRP